MDEAFVGSLWRPMWRSPQILGLIYPGLTCPGGSEVNGGVKYSQSFAERRRKTRKRGLHRPPDRKLFHF